MNDKFKKLTLIDTFWNFMIGLIAPFITIFFNEFGGFDEVGVSVAILLIIKGFTCFLTGRFLNKNNTKKILLISQIAESGRILLFLFAQNIYWVYGIQLIGGVVNGFITPAYSKLFVDVGKEEKGKSFSDRSGIITISMGVSALISGFLINFFGYALIFIIWSIAEFIYGLYIYFKL